MKLAERGWDVTGADIVPNAIDTARERARAAGVAVRFVGGDITKLGEAGVGSEFKLILDFGLVHGLTASQRAAVGREASAVAAEDAGLHMLAFAPARRGLMPRGMSREEIEATYPGWVVTDDVPQELTGAPRFVVRAKPRWYRLRRGRTDGDKQQEAHGV